MQTLEHMVDKTEKAAKRATPGGWYVGVHALSSRYTVLSSARNIHRVEFVAENLGAEDAEYIKLLGPASILALTASWKRQREALSRIQASLTGFPELDVRGAFDLAAEALKEE